jgi:hypothetical protein
MKRILPTLLVFVLVPGLQRALTLATRMIARLSAQLDRVAYTAGKGVNGSSEDDT